MCGSGKMSRFMLGDNKIVFRDYVFNQIYLRFKLDFCFIIKEIGLKIIFVNNYKFDNVFFECVFLMFQKRRQNLLLV